MSQSSRLVPLTDVLGDHSSEGIAILTAEPWRALHGLVYTMIALVLTGLIWSFFGRADVIVTEGYSGNIALKAAEGTARQMAELLRHEIQRSWLSKLGYVFARNAFLALRDKMDPNKSNGGVLLGLNGLVVKSHGGINAEGFAYAIDVGYEMAHYDLLNKINQMLNREGGALNSVQTAQEAVS